MTILDERTDEALMLAYSEGDLSSFELLFQRHRRPLFTFLLHRVGRRGVAEDLFQEVFLRVVRNRSRYAPIGTFRAWLYTITHNVVTDHHRRAGLRTDPTEQPMMYPDSDDPSREASRASCPSADPLLRSQASEQRAWIEAALARIPESQREVFLLRERAGLDYQSIAAITGDALATVKSRMRYALANLRSLLPESLASPKECSSE